MWNAFLPLQFMVKCEAHGSWKEVKKRRKKKHQGTITYKNLVLSNELIKVKLPPWKISKADVSSVSPLSTYNTHQENQVRKMFIYLGNWIELESTIQSQVICTLEYRALNPPITVCIKYLRHNTYQSWSLSEKEQSSCHKTGWWLPPVYQTYCPFQESITCRKTKLTR